MSSTVFCLLCVSIVAQASSSFQFEDVRLREKRHIIFPNGSSFMQMVLGFGLPFEVNKQSVTIGPFIKALYLYPFLASHFTNPSITDITDEYTPVPSESEEDSEDQERRKRAADTRWSFYNTLSSAAEFLGYGGKSCVLRAICEAAEIPFSEKSGVLTEILHAILTPSSTKESISNYFDNEYYAAEILGRKKKNCKVIFSECKYNFMDKFTRILLHN